MKFSKRLRYSSVSLAVVLLCSATAAFAAPPDVSDVSANAAHGIRQVLFAVSVNGMPAGEPVVLLSDGDGLYASEDDLRSWRLRPWNPALRYEGAAYYALDDVPGLETKIVEETQTLLLTASPALLESTGIAASAPHTIEMTPNATGAFLNYDLMAQASPGQRSLSGFFEAGLFTPAGVALSTFTGRSDTRETNLTRLETNWTHTDPEGMYFLRLGDSISRGGLGGSPVRFAGIQLARDFSTQPGFLTIPLPSIGGEAELPSVVDVYVNDVLTQSRDVPPGPFNIANVPVITGGGDIQLVVRDVLGRETLVRQPYYTAGEMLRRGLVDYSFEVGFLRQHFGLSSFDYGSPVVSGTYRQGITNRFTAEFHGEATPDAQMSGLGATLAIAETGVLDVSASISHSALGVGTRYEMGFESRTPRLSYGAVAELISDDFVTSGSVGADQRPPRSTLQAFAGIPARFGSLGLSYLFRDARDQPDLQLLSATASIRLGKLGTLYLTARTSLSGPANHAVALSLTIPFGGSASVSAGAELSDQSAFRASLQKSLPAGEGFGYRAGVQMGEVDRFDGGLGYQTGFGTYGMDVSWVDSQAGVRLTASGGIGAVGGSVFASRELSQSFATVKVGNYEGVHVYADNQPVGMTNSSGVAVLPRLRPYENNAVRIEVADLPIEAQIDESELIVRPQDRSGVVLDFGVRPSRSALVTLVREDGTPPPAGASVRLDERDEEFVVASGGMVYLTSLAFANSGVAIWATGSCTFDFDYSQSSEPQPQIGPLQCRKER